MYCIDAIGVIDGIEGAIVVLTAEMKIIDLLELYPETKEVFIAFGMGCLDCMGASMETIENGARMHGVQLTALLEALNRVVGN